MKKIGLFFFFFYPFLFVISQDWKIEVAKDNFFTIEENFYQNKKNQLTVVLYNSNKSYFFTQSFSNKIDVRFPKDFTLKKGDSILKVKEKLSLVFYINRQKIRGPIDYTYIPNPKGFFQLIPIVENLNFPISNKEKILDQYQWTDTLGDNYFIRTQLNYSKGKFIYFYHFLKQSGTFKQLNKISDKASASNQINHKIESIQITDLNENNIAEISCSYFIYGNTKTILITKGKKYYLRKNNKNKINLGNNIKLEGEFMRFLINKSENKNS